MMLPEILVVELDIFDWDGSQMQSGSQYFPDELNLSEGFEKITVEFCAYGWKFELFAFLSCRGPSLQDCLYTAVVKKQNQWYEFASTGVKAIGELRALTAYTPQTAFYRMVKT